MSALRKVVFEYYNLTLQDVSNLLLPPTGSQGGRAPLASRGQRPRRRRRNTPRGSAAIMLFLILEYVSLAFSDEILASFAAMLLSSDISHLFTIVIANHIIN